MKKCPFCAEEIQDETIKCSYCGGVLDKYKDWDGMWDKKQPEKWYFKTFLIVIAFLCVGPLALPLVWLNPRFSQKTKIIVTIIVIILSYCLGSLLINSLRSIKQYYGIIFQSNF